MMEKIRTFFTTNLLVKVLAVVIGIAFWIIIFNIQDPTTKVYVNVPVEYINENLLLAKHNRVFLSGPSTVSVAVTVHTSQSDQVDPSLFSCTADLTATTGADLTRQSLRTEVEQVDGFNFVLDWSYTRGDPFVTVALDEYVSKPFVVGTKWESTEIDGMQVRTIQYSPETIYVSGPASRFTNVNSVKVPLVISEVARNLTNGVYQGKMPIKIYDANDAALPNITDFNLSTEFVTMYAEIDNLVSVPLKLSGTPNGTPAEGYYYNGATVFPENITLLSLEDIKVDSITIPLSDPAIDINGLTSSVRFTVDLSGYEPEGVHISEETADILIQISANSTMSYSFYSVEMEHRNTALYNYTLRNRPSITVSGTEAAIAALTEESFKARINVSGLEAGTYNVPVSVSLPPGVTITTSNLTAEILVTYIETAPPETTTETPPTETPDESETPSESAEETTPEDSSVPSEHTEAPTTEEEESVSETPPEESSPEPTAETDDEESTAAP